MVLFWRAYRTGRRELGMIAVIMPLFCIARAPLMYLVTLATPHTIDAVLAPLDFGLGNKFYSWLTWHPVCRETLHLAYYNALPFWISVVLAWSDESMQMMKACIVAAVTAVPVYIACPAVGPVWVGTADAPRNCIPSLHLTWALLAVAYSPRSLRYPSAVLAILIAFSTIGLGEHYIVDLIAAVPFTVLIVALGRVHLAESKTSLEVQHGS